MSITNRKPHSDKTVNLPEKWVSLQRVDCVRLPKQMLYSFLVTHFSSVLGFQTIPDAMNAGVREKIGGKSVYLGCRKLGLQLNGSGSLTLFGGEGRRVNGPAAKQMWQFREGKTGQFLVLLLRCVLMQGDRIDLRKEVVSPPRKNKQNCQDLFRPLFQNGPKRTVRSLDTLVPVTKRHIKRTAQT